MASHDLECSSSSFSRASGNEGDIVVLISVNHISTSALLFLQKNVHVQIAYKYTNSVNILKINH